MATILQFDPYSAKTPDLSRLLQDVRGEADWVGLRYIKETTTVRNARDGRAENSENDSTAGIMVEVFVAGQFAYAGTCDTSAAGVQKATREAVQSAKIATKTSPLFAFSKTERPKAQGEYRSQIQKPIDQISVAQLMSLLIECTQKLKVHDDIVSCQARASFTETENHYVTSAGTDIRQNFLFTTLNLQATGRRGGDTQTRSGYGPVSVCRQQGLEMFDRETLLQECDRVSRELLELLAAENCPTDTRDVILAPDQMTLQIHESIGHPLELDRILGDERNYAGWSFVQPHDFGKLQYGSKLMNVTFDPTVHNELASYNFDDCGNPATRKFLIKDGVLVQGLGSLESQSRMQSLFGVSGNVANFRAASWNRAPLDRMANINLEPGESTLAQMVGSIEKGIYMMSNRSWSIDDYRNKFQFGCEYARLIENGKLTKVVKNPNYRGSTTQFWRGLAAVGRRDEWEVYGSPWCGKGEPSQVIRVGHGSPPCHFSNVEIFGGGQ